MRPDFCAFILTHGRPDKVYTVKSLRRCGYTGPIKIIIDSSDKTKDDYIKNFGDDVIVFDKKAVAKDFDPGDNFTDMRGVIYARNACFGIAEQLGFKYFIELDDDYRSFLWKFDDNLDYREVRIKNFDRVLEAMVRFYENVPGMFSICLAQNVDYIGGKDSTFGRNVLLSRKCMNSFICSTDRRFTFMGRINEDVNVYTYGASTGRLFFTTSQVALSQIQTQANSGGMTELYLDRGTYVKSFYSVIFQPSAVKVALMGALCKRLHHRVSWKNSVPLILREEHRKGN